MFFSDCLKQGMLKAMSLRTTMHVLETLVMFAIELIQSKCFVSYSTKQEIFYVTVLSLEGIILKLMMSFYT